MDLKRTNQHFFRRGKKGRAPTSIELSASENVDPSIALKETRKFTMPDIGLAIFAHAKNSTALSFSGEKINQYRSVENRPSYPNLLEQDVWVSEINELSFLAEKKIIVKGPMYSQRDIKAFCRMYPFLRRYFFAILESGSGDFKINLADLIRELANHECREYYRSFVSIILFLNSTLQISSKEEKLKSLLEDEAPLLASNFKEVLEQLSSFLTSTQHNKKTGTQLIEAAKKIYLDLSYTALEAMFFVGSPTLISGHLENKEVHFCNLTQVIHPDSPEGLNIGMAGIRALAAIQAFAPYIDESSPDPYNSRNDKSNSNPLKVLNLEAIAAISGRLKMFQSNFGTFVSTVLNRIVNLVGEFFCEAKSNLHVLFHQKLTQISSKAYDKMKSQFKAAKSLIQGPKKNLIANDRGGELNRSESKIGGQIPKDNTAIMAETVSLLKNKSIELNNDLKAKLNHLLALACGNLSYEYVLREYNSLLFRIKASNP